MSSRVIGIVSRNGKFVKQVRRGHNIVADGWAGAHSHHPHPRPPQMYSGTQGIPMAASKLCVFALFNSITMTDKASFRVACSQLKTWKCAGVSACQREGGIDFRLWLDQRETSKRSIEAKKKDLFLSFYVVSWFYSVSHVFHHCQTGLNQQDHQDSNIGGSRSLTKLVSNSSFDDNILFFL